MFDFPLILLFPSSEIHIPACSKVYKREMASVHIDTANAIFKLQIGKWRWYETPQKHQRYLYKLPEVFGDGNIQGNRLRRSSPGILLINNFKETLLELKSC